MSGVTLPVSRATRRAMLVASPACRPQLLGLVQQLQFPCAQVDDPYTAMAELCRHPAAYGAMILSLMSVYRDELQLIPVIKRRVPQLEIWLAHAEGRQATLAEALHLGADGLLTEEGLQRKAVTPASAAYPPRAVVASKPTPPTPLPPVERTPEPDFSSPDPVLTPEELRALLQDEPYLPTGSDE